MRIAYIAVERRKGIDVHEGVCLTSMCLKLGFCTGYLNGNEVNEESDLW